MKNYVLLILIGIFLPVGFSYGFGACDGGTEEACCMEDIDRCCNDLYPDNLICESVNGGSGGGTGANCETSKQYTEGGVVKCCDGIIQAGQCITNTEGKMGIDINQDCLVNGQCTFDIYETLGIRKSLPKETRSSPGIFVQDIILSATFFVGTLITAVLIISGLLFVFSAAKPELAAKAKKGITGSLIGLLFVVGSYAFVRLIQFLITGGGG